MIFQRAIGSANIVVTDFNPLEINVNIRKKSRRDDSYCIAIFITIYKGLVICADPMGLDCMFSLWTGFNPSL